MDDSVKVPPASEGSDEPELISPLQFDPLASVTVKRRAQLKPAVILLLSVGLLACLVLWFLFTAKSVQIKTDPSDARYAVSAGMSIKLGGRYLMRPGNYQLQASHKAYYPFQQEFTVGADDRQLFEFPLQRLPDKLQVTSIPVAAIVSIDGEVRGKTPVQAVQLARGKYRLQLEAPRYLPYEEILAVEGGGNSIEKLLELAPAWADISIDSEPAGATLTVDGETRGVTPIKIGILRGGHTLGLQMAGHKTWTMQLEVQPGEAQQLPAVLLQKADALLRVNTTPANAGILLDGIYRGQSPLELELNPGKKYRIELFKTGYQNASRSVSLKSGEHEKLTVRFEPLLGEVNFVTKPADAQLSVDGVVKKSASGSLKLAATAHKIRVTKPGYKPFETSITPKPGFPQRLDITLLTLKQAKLEALKASITTAAGQKMLLLQPGSFTMGASRREPGRRANEVLRNVNLTRPFYLGSTEVTNAEFKQFSAQHTSGRASDKSLNGDQQPVVNVTFLEAARYCNWLSERDKLKPVYTFEDDAQVNTEQKANGYRLPTEAEWAWAARKTTDGLLKYPWGMQLPPPQNAGNFADSSASYLVGQTIAKYNDTFAVTAPVASFATNAHKLYDMGGNVAEWTNDYYGQVRPASDEPEVDPTGPETGKFHVIRGSSWRHGSPVELRLSFRDYGDKGRDDLGFRLARNAGE